MVCFGSDSDLPKIPIADCFTPTSGHRRQASECPPSANRDLGTHGLLASSPGYQFAGACRQPSGPAVDVPSELVLRAGRSGAVLKRDVWRTEGINCHRCRPEICADGPHIPLDYASEQSVCVVVK